MISPVGIEVFDISTDSVSIDKNDSREEFYHNAHQLGFFIFKRGFDLIVSLALLPVMFFVGVFLLILNPFVNKGPLFYAQTRMGRHCEPFTALKFRSMTCTPEIVRAHADPIEAHRITPFGTFLRRARLDELPQILNVLKGEMSLIGPRPDYFPHAQEFVRTVPGYRERHSVRPGISGLAQTEVGYAVGLKQTRKKVAADLFYIRRCGFLMEMWVVMRTLQTVFGLRGS